jgi:hypothetical protein
MVSLNKLDVYHFRVAKFPAVRNLTLFFPSNHGEAKSRIYFIGFKGEFSELKVRSMSYWGVIG